MVAVLARVGALVAVALVSGCRTGRSADIDLETAFDDHDRVCDRVHAVMGSKDEGFIAYELPAVAEIVQRTKGASGVVEACGKELLAWLQGQLAARPLDLRPRLEARVAALGPFIGAGGRGREAALATLDQLLLDGPPPTTHTREHFDFPGPGSQKVSVGWYYVVSGDSLDRWAAAALLKGSAPQADSVGWQSERVQDDYLALLVRLFAQRYRLEPPRPPTFTLHRLARAFRSPPPLPGQLGCGEAPLDLLWPELVRAHRLRPDDPRWEQLTGEVREQLQGPPARCGARVPPTVAR
jgi:hypothetical protein